LVEQLDLVAAAVEKGLIAEEEACNGADGEGDEDDEDLAVLDGAVFRYTRYLAGFLWCGRVLMLEYFFRDDTYGTTGGSGSESGGDDEPMGYDADCGGDDEYYEGMDRRDVRFAAICGF
ncbi:hypothetical protein PLICBS_006584, partial [Purpureocillium lilacinum]|uniref:uncharacterized protein n=1 Tax=Purpureocillium lilacinum TaxID=33203 RepID=UPI00207E1452